VGLGLAEGCNDEGILGKKREGDVGLIGARGPLGVVGEIGEMERLNRVGSSENRS